MPGRAVSLVGLIGVLLLAWLPALIALPPLDRDESRFAEASRQMVETGNYVDIRFASGPRYNKPIGIYWLQSLSAEVAGPALRVRIWIYRLPSLLGGILSTILLYLFARGIAPPESAVAAALLLGMSFLLSAESVIATTDAALLACVIAAQGVLLRVYVTSRNEGEAPPIAIIMAGWMAAGFGILLKGPVILAVAGVTVFVLCLWDRDFRWLRRTRPLYGSGLVLLIVLPWAVAIGLATHGAFYEQSLGRDFAAKLVAGRESHGAPPGYYLIESVIALWPATLLLIPALVWAIPHRSDAAIRFLLAWSVGAWLLFEIVPTKLPHYILPACPALALLCGLWVGSSDADRTTPRSIRLASAAVFMIGAAIAFGGAFYLPLRFGGRVGAPLAIGAAIAGASACTAGGFFVRNHVRMGVVWAIGSAFVFHLVLGIGVVPQLHDLWLSPRAVGLVAANRLPGESPIVLTGYVEPSLLFLLGPETRIVPARAVASQVAHGGLAIVEARAEPDFLAGLASSNLAAKPLGSVEGFDYSVGRKEQITLFRVSPAVH